MTVLNKSLQSSLAAIAASQLSQQQLVSPCSRSWLSALSVVLYPVIFKHNMNNVSFDCLLQDILELKLHAAVDSVRTNVVLLEKSTVAALRSENEVLLSVYMESCHHSHISLSLHRA